jgi:hypothetical protein
MSLRTLWPGTALCTLLLGAAAAAPAAPDSDKPWTTAATAGTVDEADAAIVSLNGGTATVTALATLDIRYNVVAVDGLFEPADGVQMAARFLDSGANARVKLFLYEYNLASGISTAIMTLDSDHFAGSGSYQDQTVAYCGTRMDFLNNAYYVLAQITESAAGASAGLAIVQIGGTLC